MLAWLLDSKRAANFASVEFMNRHNDFSVKEPWASKTIMLSAVYQPHGAVSKQWRKARKHSSNLALYEALFA